MSELHRFLFEGLPVRGMIVRLTDAWGEILARRAASFSAATVFGTVVASLLIDHFGLLGFPLQPVSFVRLAGAACVLAGLALLNAR